MSEYDVRAGRVEAASGVPASAGALLRAGREAAGLSIDAVAQQLKLAPRQVMALEDGEFTLLPGRTFVRGFMRNYARLVRLDPEAVLGALPAATTPTLDAPPLHPTTQTMGELPTAEAPRHGWTRWAIPLTLVAIIGATAVWEWMHPAGETVRNAGKASMQAERSAARAPEVIGTPLPNPVAASAPPVAPPPSTEATPSAPSAPAPAESPTAEKPAPTEPVAAPVAVAPAATEAPLTLSFRDYSWTQVRDRSGHVLLARMNPGRTTQSISGTPPLDVVIGNAADVTLTWRGARVELAPYTRGNVARLTLE